MDNVRIFRGVLESEDTISEPDRENERTKDKLQDPKRKLHCNDANFHIDQSGSGVTS